MTWLQMCTRHQSASNYQHLLCEKHRLRPWENSRKTLCVLQACVLSHFSHVWLFENLRTVACQVPLSMGFSRQEYSSGLPCPPPGDLPDPGIEPKSLKFVGGLFTSSTTWEVHVLKKTDTISAKPNRPIQMKFDTGLEEARCMQNMFI